MLLKINSIFKYLKKIEIFNPIQMEIDFHYRFHIYMSNSLGIQ